MNKRDGLLCEILDCGVDDLGMLDDVEYGWHYIISRMKMNCAELSFNSLMYHVVGMGKDCIQDAIADRLHELRMKGSLTNEERDESKALHSLRPEADFQSYHNYLDTNVWCEKNADIYTRYLQYALDQFEDNTGLPIIMD